MDAFFTLVMAVGGAADDGINPWGMLGCAVAYAGAIFAAVDGLGDHLLHRGQRRDAEALHGLRLKTGSKIAAAGITVVTAAIVLILDSNWIAVIVLTLLFFAVVLWVFYVYRETARAARR
jgi:hypothetical protein